MLDLQNLGPSGCHRVTLEKNACNVCIRGCTFCPGKRRWQVIRWEYARFSKLPCQNGNQTLEALGPIMRHRGNDEKTIGS